MAFLNFSEDLFVKEYDSNEEACLGSFSTANNGELAAMRVLLYIKGTTSGTEKIKINIYSDNLCQNLLHSSLESSISEITPSPNNFLGWVTVDFNRIPINKNLIYYPTLETSSYTRVGNSFVIGTVYDFPVPTYSTGVTLFKDASFGMQIFMYED